MESIFNSDSVSVHKNKTVLIASLLILVICVGLYWGWRTFETVRLQRSEPYKFVTSILTSSELVNNVMGDPKVNSKFITGNLNDSDFGGSAYMEIPVDGSIRKGIAYVFATKEAGDWYYDYVAVLTPICGERRKISNADQMIGIGLILNNTATTEFNSGGIVIAPGSLIDIDGTQISGERGAITLIQNGHKLVFGDDQISRVFFEVADAKYPYAIYFEKEENCP